MILSCGALTNPRKLPVMPEIVPVVPASVAQTKVKIRPFGQQRGARVRTFIFLKINAGNFSPYLPKALGHTRTLATLDSTGCRRLHPQGGKDCRNPQNTCWQKHCKCLFSATSHCHWRLLDLTWVGFRAQTLVSPL